MRSQEDLGAWHPNTRIPLLWYCGFMNVTMDRAGRIVLPKALRDQLGLSANDEFDVAIDGCGIRLQPRSTQTREIVTVDGWPVIKAAGNQAISDSDVRNLRDADQR